MAHLVARALYSRKGLPLPHFAATQLAEQLLECFFAHQQTSSFPDPFSTASLHCTSTLSRRPFLISAESARPFATSAESARPFSASSEAASHDPEKRWKDFRLGGASRVESLRERPVIELSPKPWGVKSKRTGVIAVKCGMTAEWDSWGVRIPLTVLWVHENHVVQVKTEDKEGFSALQIGGGIKKPKQLTKPELGHLIAAGVPIKRRLAEFRVTSDALLPVGTPLTARHFVAGQYVDIQGTTIGKGFQGVMKRHDFAGMPASHGASLSHRSGGSTGQRQDPGRVFKGRKMAGQMGNKTRTTENIRIYKVDPARSLLYVRGQVPGHKGNFVYVTDAKRKRPGDETPFPTHIPDPDEDSSSLEPIVAPPAEIDPYLVWLDELNG